VAGQGIVGDRFHGKAAHLDASGTLLAVEAPEAVAQQLDLPEVPDPLLARRDVVLRRGPAVLVPPVPLDPSAAGRAVRRARPLP
jgi:hypothetical protein